ncbi:MAG: TatD family hydrolase [Alphaproteobacteria bacterium]|nr:TatD family hydrolase [Alphaproteobacteria bacterium]
MSFQLNGVIDSHAHIDFDHYLDDREEMLARMTAAGVSDVICIGTRLSHQHGPRQMAESAPNIWFTAGVHPNHAHDQDDYANIDAYRAAVDHPRCVGVGEAGLDYFYTRSDPERQMVSFKTQLQVASETGLPIVIHSRDADEDMATTLEEFHANNPITGVMHCFSSGPELAERALKIGFYISFSGILTFKNTQAIRDIAANVPMDRLLVETDAPYLSPEPVSSIKRNEPAHVVHTLPKLAEIKGVSSAEMAAISAANTRRLFHKMDPKMGPKMGPQADGASS